MNIALNYVETGEGFPLVLLHGNGEDHTYFKRQMEPFSLKYRVIALDTRGHGKSPRGERALYPGPVCRGFEGVSGPEGDYKVSPVGVLRRGKHRSAVCHEVPPVRGEAGAEWS